jgi:hypothetical protein
VHSWGPARGGAARDPTVSVVQGGLYRRTLGLFPENIRAGATFPFSPARKGEY